MPPASADDARLAWLGDVLAALSATSARSADEVLSLYPEVAHRQTQAAVESWLDEVATLLRAIDSVAARIADDLHVAAGSHPRAVVGADVEADRPTGAGLRR